MLGISGAFMRERLGERRRSEKQDSCNEQNTKMFSGSGVCELLREAEGFIGWIGSLKPSRRCSAERRGDDFPSHSRLGLSFTLDSRLTECLNRLTI